MTLPTLGIVNKFIDLSVFAYICKYTQTSINIAYIFHAIIILSLILSY